MSAELDALLAAVFAEPDSDEPRLVYADALQAAGDPRGEFIATQCELAKLGCDRTRVALWSEPAIGAELVDDGRREWIGDGLVDADLARVAELRDRAQELFDAQIRPALAGVQFVYRFRRGFIDHAYVSDSSSRDHVFAAAPLLRSLELWQAVGEPFADPRLAQLRQLRTSVASAEAYAELAANAARWTELRELAIYDPEGVVKFLELPFLFQLEALDVYAFRFGRVEVFEEVITRARLRELRVGHMEVGSELIHALAHHPAAARLEVLDCYLADLDDAFGEWLAPCRELRALRIANHGSSCIDGAAFGALPRLRILDVGGTRSLVPRLPSLCSGAFPELVQLGLRGCEVGDQGVEYLAGSPLVGKLRTLDLADNKITARGALAIAAVQPPALRVLDLRANEIDAATLATLRARLPDTRVLARSP